MAVQMSKVGFRSRIATGPNHHQRNGGLRANQKEGNRPLYEGARLFCQRTLRKEGYVSLLEVALSEEGHGP